MSVYSSGIISTEFKMKKYEEIERHWVNLSSLLSYESKHLKNIFVIQLLPCLSPLYHNFTIGFLKNKENIRTTRID